MVCVGADGTILRWRQVGSVPSRHAGAWRLVPLTAQELLAALAAVPGAKVVPAGREGIAESRLVGGLEIAHASDPDDQALRKVWRARFGGGPTPLLVVADALGEENAVRTLGPARHDGPIRLVGAGDLLRVLERLPSLGKLQSSTASTGPASRDFRSKGSGRLISSRRGSGTSLSGASYWISREAFHAIGDRSSSGSATRSSNFRSGTGHCATTAKRSR